MHAKSKRIILVINSTLLQTSTELADWRSVIFYLIELWSSVTQSCLHVCGRTTSPLFVIPSQRHGLNGYVRTPCARTYRLWSFIRRSDK